MAEGFKIGDGYVVIRADRDVRETAALGQAITDDVEREIQAHSPEIGKHLGDGVVTGLEKEVAASRPRLARIGSGVADDIEQGVDDEIKRTEEQIVNTGRRIGKPLGRGAKERLIPELKDGLEESGRKGGPGFFRRMFESAGGSIEKFTNGFFNQFEKGIPQFKEEFQKQFESGLTSPTVIMMIGEAAIGAAPGIAAEINALLLTGIGLGGIALGVSTALSDERVQRGIKLFGSRFGASITDATSSFIHPMEHVFDVLNTDTGVWAKGLKTTMKELAPEIQPLTTAVEGFFDRLLPGIERAMVASKPLIDTFAHDLPSVGQAINNMFTAMTRGTGGANQALHGTLVGIQKIIVGFGDFVEVGSQAFSRIGGVMIDFFDNAASGAKWAFDWIPGIGKKFDVAKRRTSAMRDTFAALGRTGMETGTQLGVFGQALDKDTTSMRDQIDAMGGLTAAIDQYNLSARTAEAAAEGWEAALDNLTLSVKANGKTLDIHTAKGRNNRQMLLDGITAAEKAAQVYMDQGGTVAGAAKKYDSMIAALRREAIALGLNRAQVEAFIKALGKIPTEINSTVTTTYKTRGTAPRSGGPGGGSSYIPNARGGIYQAARGLVDLGQADMFAAGNSPIFGFAEPGTGGEGFVPRNGNPARSVPLIEQEAAWYGRHLAPPNNVSGTAVVSGGRTFNVTINLNGPWQAIDPAIPRTVVRRLHSALSIYEKSVR